MFGVVHWKTSNRPRWYGIAMWRWRWKWAIFLPVLCQSSLTGHTLSRRWAQNHGDHTRNARNPAAMMKTKNNDTENRCGRRGTVKGRWQHVREDRVRPLTKCVWSQRNVRRVIRKTDRWCPASIGRQGSSKYEQLANYSTPTTVDVSVYAGAVLLGERGTLTERAPPDLFPWSPRCDRRPPLS